MNKQDESQDNIDDVLQKLTLLEPRAADKPISAARALLKIKEKEAGKRRRFIFQLPIRLLRRYSMPALLFLLIIGFQFPTVRAAASDFLGLFRVQKFAAVSISPQQLAALQEMIQRGAMPAEFEFANGPPTVVALDDVPEAQQMVAYPLRLPTLIGNPEKVQLIPSSRGILRVDGDAARLFMQVAELDPALLPADIHGQEIEVHVPAVIIFRWPDGYSLIQTAAPEIDYPDNLDPTLIGEAILRLYGVEPAEAATLANHIDWSHTLMLPIPSHMATFKEINIDDTKGLVISGLNGSDHGVMWEKNGIIYILDGADSLPELRSLANSLEQ